MKLYPYQIAAAEFLAARKAALLADEMRVGKTGAAIRACDLVVALDVLWLTTASAKTDHARAWAELQQLERRISVDKVCDGVTITNYDRVARLPKTKRWDVLVCDESHKLKNRNAKRTKAVLLDPDALIGRVDHTWFLTGTPAPNDPSELWPMLRAAMPDAIPSKTGRPMNYWQFVDHYCQVKSNHFGLKIVGGKKLNGLRDRIRPFTLRRKLADVMKDLPAQSFELVYFDAGDALKELKADLEVELLADLLTGDVEADARMLDRVGKDVQARIRRLTGLAKVGHVIEWAKDRLDGNDDKIVLFAHHRAVLDGLQEGLRGFVPARLDGSSTAPGREASQQAFKCNKLCRVFIGQMQAAGEAIDLSAADEAMFVEASWVPKDNQQAAARVVNIGKKRPTFAWFATLAGSIDERIQRVVARKTADLAALFD